MTRVLHLTRDFPPRGNGGLSSAVGGIARGSRSAGLDVAVLSFDAWRPSGKARAEALPVVDDVLRLRGPDDLEAAQRFADRFAPDLVHVHHGMLFDAIETSAPRVFSVHVAQAVQRRLRGLERPTKSETAQRAAIDAADLVIVPSESARRDVLADHPVADPRVVPLCVEIPEATASGGDVTHAGRFADIKGTAEVLEVARRTGREIVLAGGLPDNAKAERCWRERAPTNVRFTGWLDRAALRERYLATAVLLAPSWHETFGLAVAEAMSFGVPVIASHAGALPERVTHEESGLLVPPRDPDALVDALERLLDDGGLRARLARGAQEAAKAWSPARAAEKMHAEYEKVIRGG